MAMRVGTWRNRPMLRDLLLASTVVVCLLAAACGGSNSLTAPTDLITHGVLTVGSDTSYPPQEYLDATTHQAVGFDIDLITAIATRLGLKVRVVSTAFDPLLGDLVAKHFDVAISAITITPERQKQADFIPYVKVGESLLVPKGNPRNIASTDDLCGLNVGVEEGTIEQGVLQSSSDNCLEQDKPAITLLATSDQAAVIQLLSTGQVAATFQDSTVTDYYIKQDPTHFQAGGPVVFPAPEGIAVRTGDTSMFASIQAALDQVKSSGTYHQLALKWSLTPDELIGG
jgi:polar amino acid transport system substrate-binding protein